MILILPKKRILFAVIIGLAVVVLYGASIGGLILGALVGGLTYLVVKVN